MNRYRLAFIVAAIALIVMWLWGSPADFRQIQSLLTAAPSAPGPNTTEPTSEPIAREPTPETPSTDTAAKCLDGSALTVTGRDSNQTNYRCSSGAIGAHTNKR